MTTESTTRTLSQEIAALKKEKNAIVLAHYYQHPDIQDIADMPATACKWRNMPPHQKRIF